MDMRRLIEFLDRAERLKCNTRHCVTSTGRPESVAEHSWRAALMAMLLGQAHPDLDTDRVIRMCLVHDLGEAVTGDIPSFAKTGGDEETEKQAVAGLLAGLESPAREELEGLFAEMEARKTGEARLFKAIDKLEAVLSHNEAPLGSWAPLEYKLNRIYGEKEADISPAMRELRRLLREDTDQKIAAGPAGASGTVKLYEEDSFRKTCTVRVTGCERDGENWAVTLDSTVFFPEGGGQPSDTGRLGDAVVSYVYEREGQVFHRCDRPLEPGAEVEAAIDWERRLDHIQQHTGEHILSYAIWKAFGVGNTAFHLGHERVSIDLGRALTPQELEQAEDAANRIVWEDRPIRTYWRRDDDLGDLDMRKKTEKVSGMLRIVEVEGSDICTCCGTHAASSGQVGLIKILRQENHKGGVRLEFVCGGRALRDYRGKHQQITAVGGALSTKEEGILAALGNLKEEAAHLRGKLRSRSALLMAARARELAGTAAEKNGRRAVCAVADDIDAGEAKMLLSALLEQGEKNAAAVVYAHGEQVGYLLGSAPGGLDCRTLCQAANGLWNGKGGGSPAFAQGRGKRDAGWRESAEALRRLMEQML